MATLAVSFREVLRLLEPFPGRLEFALRLAFICALTVLVAEIYQTPDPALTTYVVFFLNKPERTTSLILSMAMLALISLIVGGVILVAIVVINETFWRVASMTAISVGLLFLASASKLRPVGAIMALIAAYGLDELGLAPVGEVATRGLLYVWLFIGIPAGVSIGVNLLLAPSPRSLCERALALRLRLAAAMLRAPDDEVRRQFTECLREANGELSKQLKLALVEKSATHEQIAALRHAAESSFEIISLIDVTDRDPNAALPPALRERLALALEALSRKVGSPASVEFGAPVEAEPALPPLAARVVASIKAALIALAGAAPRPSPEGESVTPPPEPAKTSNGFFLPDAFTNPDHVNYALKTTAAAMFCYILYSQLDWQGIHTCFITCYIVALETTAETIEKLALRILGCLIGAAAGYAAIIYLIPSLTSIGALMAVVFLGALASAWVAAGTPRIAYAGFQMAFAFFLCVIQGSGPSFDLTVARDRVIGILLGNLVVYLVFTNVWPVSVARRIDARIAGILRRMSGSLHETSRTARCADASEMQQMLAGVEQDLQLARYEPLSVRPSESWLSVRCQAAEDCGALFGPLLLAADKGLTPSAKTAARLDRLADKLDALEPAPILPGGGVAAHEEASKEVLDPAQQPLRDAIDRRLARLEQAFYFGAESGDQQADYAPV